MKYYYDCKLYRKTEVYITKSGYFKLIDYLKNGSVRLLDSNVGFIGMKTANHKFMVIKNLEYIGKLK